MLELQPVTTSSEGVFDQDTTMPDGGFLSKLTKQEQERDKYRKSGILSPEEGVRLFTEVGESMFGDAEDLELIESITGKKSKTASPSPPSSSTTASTPQKKEQDKNIAVEEDFLRSMMGGSAPTKIPSPPSQSSATSSSPPPVKKSPPLSPEEAADLQSRLDQLSDEQVEKVFKKMRESLGDKLREELKANMDGKRAKGSILFECTVLYQHADEYLVNSFSIYLIDLYKMILITPDNHILNKNLYVRACMCASVQIVVFMS